jgi:hypothetical protein
MRAGRVRSVTGREREMPKYWVGAPWGIASLSGAHIPPRTSSAPRGSASSGDTSRARYQQSRAFAELLIDCEEDRTLRAVLVGMLREGRPANPFGNAGSRRLRRPKVSRLLACF